MRVCWQTTTGQPSSDTLGSVTLPNTDIPSHNEVPSIRFNPSVVSPISAASLRYAIQVRNGVLTVFTLEPS